MNSARIWKLLKATFFIVLSLAFVILAMAFTGSDNILPDVLFLIGLAGLFLSGAAGLLAIAGGSRDGGA